MTAAEIAIIAFRITDWSRVPSGMEARIGRMMAKDVPDHARPKRIRSPQAGAMRPRDPKLVERDRAIVAMREGGSSITRVADAFGVSLGTVQWVMKVHRKGQE